MPNNLPLRRLVKLRARRLMLNPYSLRVTLAVVGASLGCFLLRVLCNGTLSFTVASLAQFGQTTSGVHILDEGISIIFRMDLTGMVAALSVTYSQLAVFLAVNLVFFLLLSPLRAGAMEAYWRVTRGEKRGKVSDLLQWFVQRNRLVKAWVIQFCLQVLVGAVTFVASTPAMYLFYRFYSSTPDEISFDLSRRLMLWSADGLAILAMLFGIWLHSLLLPALYCLAAHPEYSLGETFRRGFRSVRDIRGGFYRFRLSYILWFFISRLTYGAMDFFVLPYSAMGGMLYIQESARLRDRPREEAPAGQQGPDREEWYAGAAWPPVETPPEGEDDMTPEPEVFVGAEAQPESETPEPPEAPPESEVPETPETPPEPSDEIGPPPEGENEEEGDE